MKKWLGEANKVNKDVRFELLYNGTEYGCSAITFHKKCDGQGPTVTFARSADHGRVFGGYTSMSWNSSSQGDYQKDPQAFIFSLTNQTYHPIKESHLENAVWHHSNFLVYFGQYDFFVVDNCFQKVISDMSLGHSYQLGNVSGNWAGLNRTHLTGARDFSYSEVEVYKVIFSD